MKKVIMLASAAMIYGTLFTGMAGAQGAPQTLRMTKANVSMLSTAYRSSKVVGSDVVNDTNDTIGKIDDLLVSRDGKHPYAVISVGGFLGMGDKLVIVPYDELSFAKDKIMLRGGTKAGLKALPEFKYATN